MIDRVDVGGGSLALAFEAAEGEPQGVVMSIHGYTGGKEDFWLSNAGLSQSGYHAFSYDQRGHHDSDRFESYEVDDFARDAVALVAWARAELELPVHLLGHSFGGLVAQRAVTMIDPEVASLHLVCTGPAGFRVVGATEHPASIERAQRFEEILRTEGMAAAVRVMPNDGPVKALLDRRFLASDPKAMIDLTEDLLDCPDLVDAARATGVPVSWYTGANDGTWGQRVQRATAERYGTEPVVIADAGHVPFVDQAEAFVAELLARLL